MHMKLTEIGYPLNKLNDDAVDDDDARSIQVMIKLNSRQNYVSLKMVPDVFF